LLRRGRSLQLGWRSWWSLVGRGWKTLLFKRWRWWLT
jgi:hypothetical protein